MAMVDFSNAVLTPQDNGSIVTRGGYSYLNQANFSNLTTPGVPINSNANVNVITNDVNKAVVSYTGVFTESGSGFYIGLNGAYPRWKVTGVSFEAGDGYSFQITLNLTCN